MGVSGEIPLCARKVSVCGWVKTMREQAPPACSPSARGDRDWPGAALPGSGSVKIHHFCSGHISVDPICPQPRGARCGIVRHVLRSFLEQTVGHGLYAGLVLYAHVLSLRYIVQCPVDCFLIFRMTCKAPVAYARVSVCLAWLPHTHL